MTPEKPFMLEYCSPPTQVGVLCTMRSAPGVCYFLLISCFPPLSMETWVMTSQVRSGRSRSYDRPRMWNEDGLFLHWLGSVSSSTWSRLSIPVLTLDGLSSQFGNSDSPHLSRLRPSPDLTLVFFFLKRRSPWLLSLSDKTATPQFDPTWGSGWWRPVWGLYFVEWLTGKSPSQHGSLSHSKLHFHSIRWEKMEKKPG